MTFDRARTHDLEIYLQEERADAPKECFVLACDMMQEAGLAAPGRTWLDVGCATGDFIAYGTRRFPEMNLVGYDVIPDFVEAARRRIPGARFEVGSITDLEMTAAGSADIVTAAGVISIFDQFEPLFDHLIQWTRPGGAVIVYGAFNPQPIDVWLQYRKADAPVGSPLEVGWNIVSQASASAHLDRHPRVTSHRFVPHTMGVDLPPHADDPVRSWTFKDERGERHLTNGLSLLLPMHLLEIRVR